MMSTVCPVCHDGGTSYCLSLFTSFFSSLLPHLQAHFVLFQVCVMSRHNRCVPHGKSKRVILLFQVMQHFLGAGFNGSLLCRIQPVFVHLSHLCHRGLFFPVCSVAKHVMVIETRNFSAVYNEVISSSPVLPKRCQHQLSQSTEIFTLISICSVSPVQY